MNNLKVEFAGTVYSIDPIKKYDNFSFQKVNIFVKARTDEFGESVGKDKVFPVQASNTKIELINKLQKGDKVKVEAFVDARTSEVNNEESYFLQLNLYKISVVEQKKEL